MVELLALRHRVPDSTLLDAMELADWLPPPPCRVRRGQLERLWQISQPALCRRLQRLAAAGLLDCEQRWGAVLIRRIGPVGDCDDKGRAWNRERMRQARAVGAIQ